MRVALGWLWGRNRLAINRLWGGFDVALGGLPGDDAGIWSPPKWYACGKASAAKSARFSHDPPAEVNRAGGPYVPCVLRPLRASLAAATRGAVSRS
jgi:hypothetical protein